MKLDSFSWACSVLSPTHFANTIYTPKPLGLFIVKNAFSLFAAVFRGSSGKLPV